MYRTALTIAVVVATSALVADEPAPKGEQGVTGKVLKLSGNFQPQAVLEGEAPPLARGAKETLLVPVHVFKGKVEPFAKPNPKHPQLITIAKPDKTGVFRVPLDPGEYTVVAEIDGKLYLNLASFDAATKKAIWATVPVKAKEWTQWNIEDTSDAAF